MNEKLKAIYERAPRLVVQSATARVRQYERRTPSGKIVTVREHARNVPEKEEGDERTRRHLESWDAARRAGHGAAPDRAYGLTRQDVERWGHTVPKEYPPGSDAAYAWIHGFKHGHGGSAFSPGNYGASATDAAGRGWEAGVAQRAAELYGGTVQQAKFMAARMKGHDEQGARRVADQKGLPWPWEF